MGILLSSMKQKEIIYLHYPTDRVHHKLCYTYYYICCLLLGCCCCLFCLFVGFWSVWVFGVFFVCFFVLFLEQGKKDEHVLFNDALNTFAGTRHL